jgi:anaerobic selenocysteine-containing dehydrogenase
LLVEVGKRGIERVSGDSAHPHARGVICGKCAIAYNSTWLTEDARLKFPLKRIGSRGSGAFERIAWPEALELIARRMKSAVASQGAHTIIHAHYQGTYAAIGCNFPVRFFNRLGATEVEPSSICDKAGHEALAAMYGTSFVGFDPRTSGAAKTILMWGINPSHSAPVTDQLWLSGFRGTRIVVDPLKTGTAKKADLHLQLRPGSDAVLVYAMLKSLKSAGLLDRPFIERHVRGSRAVNPGMRADLGDGTAVNSLEVEVHRVGPTR